jgi:hypothetical protein
MTLFHCLRSEAPPTWRATSPYLYPPGTGWPGYTPRRWVPVSSPPTTRRATVEVFDPACTRVLTSDLPSLNCSSSCLQDKSSARTTQKTQPLYCWGVFTQLFHRNCCTRHISFRHNSSIVACGHCLPTAVFLAPQFLLWANTPQYFLSQVVVIGLKTTHPIKKQK